MKEADARAEYVMAGRQSPQNCEDLRMRARCWESDALVATGVFGFIFQFSGGDGYFDQALKGVVLRCVAVVLGLRYQAAHIVPRGGEFGDHGDSVIFLRLVKLSERREVLCHLLVEAHCPR
jgi:hypothetical protein